LIAVFIACLRILISDRLDILFVMFFVFYYIFLLGRRLLLN